MRYLGIDYGSKRVGIALSDIGGQMAFPKKVIKNSPRLSEEIEKLCKEENVGAIVIGESKDYKGAQNQIARSAQKLVDVLAKRTKLPIYFELEFLTSAEAGRIQGKEAGDDASAAALILGSFLQKKKHREQ